MPTKQPTTQDEMIKSLSSELTGWLTKEALPTWQANGLDAAKGECFEAIDLVTGQATTSPRRARVIPRQIYSFLEGEKLGWHGPGRETANSLLDWYLATYLT
ncbi:MAG: AGE family epimerase/isomerase, partial [Pseudomonadota bacterium]